ncbi:hypothetical protein D3C73_961050 [compost metagenome]
MLQFFFEVVQFAFDRVLEIVRADRAFAQQYVQQLVVGAQLFHEGFHRHAHHAGGAGRSALAGFADDGAQ